MTSTYEYEFFRTSGVEDFKLPEFTDFPIGYPTKRVEDLYIPEIIGKDFDERRRLFVDHVSKNPGINTVKGFFYDIIRVSERITPIHYKGFYSAIRYVNGRHDCADFALNGLMRLYKQFGDNELVTNKLKKAIKECMLEFKYWPDEPGIDSMCYWTENHHIIFSTAEYLAGQWLPDEIFKNSGHSGREKEKRGKDRILRWMELRFYTGFSEWLSNVYYDEDFLALLNLYDFAEDIEIKRKAKGILDMMLFDMASNSYKGQFTSTHGRTYTKEKLNPLDESTIDTSKLLFGLGRFANRDNMSAVIFALSSYRVPKVIEYLAQNVCDREWINKQRVSIKLSHRKQWGMNKINTKNGLELLSFGGYSHPYSFNHLAYMLDKFNWWDNKFFLELKAFKPIIKIGKYIGLTNIVAWLLRKDMSRNSYEESNIYTYRTPDYMLSTSQNYRHGYGGDQHHIWQATLDKECVVFTTHPGGYGMTAPDAYWHGNGFLPKSIQYKNVNIIIYNTPTTPTVIIKRILKFTHAFFPKSRFDEVVEKDGWIFGRSNNGYIALYSLKPWMWQQKGDFAESEIIVKGKKNIWITELGRKEIHSNFNNFIQEILSNKLNISGLNIKYHSKQNGIISCGWHRPLKVDGKKILIKDYPKYSNKASKTPFMSNKIQIRFKGEDLIINK